MLEQVKKTARGLLNRLSPERFEQLSEQIIEHIRRPETLNSVELLKEIVLIVFDKALLEVGAAFACRHLLLSGLTCTQPFYASMYADLCARISEAMAGVELTEEKVESDGQVVRLKTTFKKLLLNRCQEEFENGALRDWVLRR